MKYLFALQFFFGSFSFAQSVDITFSVDMRNQIVSEKGVHIAGSFQDWNPADTEMLDVDNDSIYTITLPLESESNFEYKFINGDSWDEDESVQGECGNGNRILNTTNVTTYLETVCFASCYACNYVPETVEVTFHVDMSNEVISEEGVHLAGSFQDWSPSTTEMYDLDNDSIYSVSLSVLVNSSFEYKFINGNTWEEDESVLGICGDGNRTLNTSTIDFTLDVSCFNSCYNCDYIPTFVDVNFYLDLSHEDISANGVHIAADFLSWYPDGTEMTDLDNDSIYEFSISLLANTTYEYKYINGNTWAESEDVNGFCGQGNRTLNTLEEDMPLDTVCFASCEACPPAYVDVTFNLDMQNDSIYEGGIQLVGDFQNWSLGETQLLDEDGDGVYSITLSVAANAVFDYKYVNGISFDDGETVLGPCGTGNRILNTLEEEMVLDVVCFNSCFACGEEAPFVDVVFQLDMNHELVSEDGVHIVGSFQGWDPASTEMLDVDSNGVYTITLSLMSNTNYEYKFVNGNSWGQDEAMQGFCGYGNRDLTTLNVDMTLNLVCFNLCDVCPDFETVPEGIVDGLNIVGDSAVIFSVFAPHKNFVHLIGDFNDWQQNTESMMKKDVDADRFWIQINGLDPNTEYRYQYSIDLNSLRIADIYSNKILDQSHDDWILEDNWENHPSHVPFPHEVTSGHVSCFTINDNYNYTWEVENFYKPEKEKLVIYELLIRDFLETQSYTDLIDTLDYLENLGINAIELMPVNEFEGNSSWGYNPSYYFAPDKAYGSIYDLKHFVDECHQRGIAIIMDIALNHSFGQNPQVQMYFDHDYGDYGKPSAENPWFNQYPTHDFNVGYDYNHESAHTKYFCKRVFEYWIEEFKIDGFRLDLSKGYTQNQTIGNINAWSSYDQSRVNILQDYGNHIWSVNPYTYVILEHFGDNNEEMTLANSGFMLWGNMHAEYSQATMGYGGDLSRAIHTNRGWDSPHLISYMESHDEERIMFGNLQFGNAYNAYDIKDFNTAIERMKLAYTFLLLAPGPKMIWQFGELGYDYSIEQCEGGNLHSDCLTYPKPLRWDYVQDSVRQELYQMIGAVNYLKTKVDVFSSMDFSYDVWGEVKRITLSSPEGNATVIGNFSLSEMMIHPNFQHTGQWFDYISGTSIVEDNLDNSFLLAPGEYRIYTDFPISNTVDITFQLNMQNEDVSEQGVHIAGEFQGWNPSSTLMQDEDGDGIYSITLNLAANTTYEYKFVNGDAWGLDETLNGDCGDGNRILATANGDLILEPVCFASCLNCMSAPDDWEVQVTSSNHTLVIPEQMDISINGISITDEVFIGVFYTNASGEQLCAGYTSYTGGMTQIAAMADDETTVEIDGYQSEQEFVFKLWDGVAIVEIDATYAAGELSEFQINGITMVERFFNHPIGWDVIVTEANHTIMIPDTLEINVDGLDVNSNLCIGVFYQNSMGDTLCAGYTYFNNETSQIAVMGDDSTTEEIDGYQAGQEFVFLIWDGSEEWEVQGNFFEDSPTQYQSNGLSFIESLGVSIETTSEQLIDLPIGWSLFSAYILTENMDVAQILSPVVSNIVIVKNNDGAAYLVDWAFNGIGDFLVGQGYQVKTSSQTSFIMQGDFTPSDQYPTSLTEGWNMIGYLNMGPISADVILADLVEQENLIIAKDENGSAYLPAWNFNGIGAMKPGKGYQLKVHFEMDLTY